MTTWSMFADTLAVATVTCAAAQIWTLRHCIDSQCQTSPLTACLSHSSGHSIWESVAMVSSGVECHWSAERAYWGRGSLAGI